MLRTERQVNNWHPQLLKIFNIKLNSKINSPQYFSEHYEYMWQRQLFAHQKYTVLCHNIALLLEKKLNSQGNILQPFYNQIRSHMIDEFWTRILVEEVTYFLVHVPVRYQSTTFGTYVTAFFLYHFYLVCGWTLCENKFSLCKSTEIQSFLS